LRGLGIFFSSLHESLFPSKRQVVSRAYREFSVPLGNHGVDSVNAPIKADAAPQDPGVAVRRVDGVGLVNKAGIILETEESVRKADRDVDNVSIRGGQFVP